MAVESAADAEDGEVASNHDSLSPKRKKLVEYNSLMLTAYDRPRRDEAFQDQYRSGGGQSYRPGGGRDRSPPPARARSPPPPPPRPATDSYRARSPPRRTEYTDSYRAPPRPRSRSPPPRREEFRRRSPSPPRYRDARDVRGDSYRGRPRSPPPARREELPRDDLFRREPAREYARDEREYGRDDRAYGAPARSPVPRYRERSPLPLKRTREPSPIGSRGRRTPPPPAKRERLASPPRGRYDEYPPSRAASPPRRRYSPDPRDRRPASPPRGATREYRPRSRSPVRSERVDPRAVDDWRRPRSPSPARYARQDYSMEDAGRDSVATSRRSSPPVHPSRLAFQPADERAGRQAPRDPYEREPYREPEPSKRRDSPPPKEREYVEERYANGEDRVPPPREPYRASDAPPVRAPPAGPAGFRAPSTSMAPPSGPAAAVSVSAHQRAPAVPPSGPRAAAAAPMASRGDFGPRGRGGFRGGFGGAPFRGGRGGGPGLGPGPSPGFGRGQESFNRESFDTNAGGPPSGPRGSFSSQSPATAGAPPSGPGFRQNINNSTATTYPRSQRFAHNGQPLPEGPASHSPHPPSGPRLGRRPTEPFATSQTQRTPSVHPAIADLPKIIEGGQKAEPIIDMTRLSKLQEEAEKLRRVIEEKETKKRKSLREWDRMSREVEVAGLRSELAERAVRELNGEAEGQAAF